jgi:hypothetical protein
VHPKVVQIVLRRDKADKGDKGDIVLRKKNMFAKMGCSRHPSYSNHASLYQRFTVALKPSKFSKAAY